MQKRQLKNLGNIGSHFSALSGANFLRNPNKAICSLALILFCLLLNGCGGLIGLGVGAAGRAAGTGDTYSSWKSTMPNIPPNKGRLFVYVTEHGGGFYAIQIATGAEELFTIDKDICAVLGKTFMYRDLPVGDHDVSADDVREYLSDITGRFRKGKYDVKVRIVAGGSTYVRIAKDGARSVPQLVDATTANSEMTDLPIDKHFVTFECRENKVEDRGK